MQHTLSLCLIRASLGLSVEEAATHILGVTPATWEAWESAKVTPPEWVLTEVSRITQEHQSMFSVMRKLLKEEALLPLSYETYVAYLLDHPESTFVSWRISKSVVKHFRETEAH